MHDHVFPYELNTFLKSWTCCPFTQQCRIYYVLFLSFLFKHLAGLTACFYLQYVSMSSLGTTLLLFFMIYWTIIVFIGSSCILLSTTNWLLLWYILIHAWVIIFSWVNSGSDLNIQFKIRIHFQIRIFFYHYIGIWELTMTVQCCYLFDCLDLPCCMVIFWWLSYLFMFFMVVFSTAVWLSWLKHCLVSIKYFSLSFPGHLHFGQMSVDFKTVFAIKYFACLVNWVFSWLIV